MEGYSMFGKLDLPHATHMHVQWLHINTEICCCWKVDFEVDFAVYGNKLFFNGIKQ
jgi:hypothetical protein